MYDFQDTLDRANKAFESKDYAQAAYWYWEINFAYEDEEFPIYYTTKIGGDAHAGFERTMQLISAEDILKSKFYQTLQQLYGDSKYTKKYLVGFEQEIAKYALTHPQ